MTSSLGRLRRAPLGRSGRVPLRQAATVLATAFGVFVVGACSSTLAQLDVPGPSTSAAPKPSAAGASSASKLDVPTFAALNQAVGFGRLRLMTLEERPNALDIAIYQALPNEMPRVAGVITTVGQTPLSHVNLRAVQDNVPNAVAGNLLDDPTITALIGKSVKYTVTEAGFTFEPVTQAEVDAHHAASRPTESQTPQRDLTIKKITPLTEVGFEKWRAFGVKAANLSTLRSFNMPDVYVPDGYAVPFYFYDTFMKYNDLYDRMRKMMANPKFYADADYQDAQLAEFRDTIKGSPMPEWMYNDLTKLQKLYPADIGIRCRSSTNNEDLPNFSGAGLYDSYTQHPEEGHMSKCIKQVFASVWSLRAFVARDFYRIDHMNTAMGVVVYPSFEGERANGVAVTADPVYQTDNAFYVNTQLGDDLVTNPLDQSTPEELLIYPDGEANVVVHSNRVAPGETVLTKDQIALMKASLTTIHERFSALYKIPAGQKFAMEIEFKILTTGQMAIKQARTWIFR